jgi:hypothetical protein
MSALRYSGEVTIRVTWIDTPGRNNHGGHYRCTLSRTINKGTQWEKRVSTTQYVGAPAFLERGVGIDSSEAFDDTAHAALSFASNEETAEDDDPNGWAEHAAYKADGSGWLIARAPAKRWGKEEATTS